MPRDIHGDYPVVSCCYICTERETDAACMESHVRCVGPVCADIGADHRCYVIAAVWTTRVQR